MSFRICLVVLGVAIAATGCSDDGDDGTGGANSTSSTGGSGGSSTGGSGGSSTGGSGGSSTGGSGGSGVGGGNAAPHQECVDLINGHRASVALPAYQRWTSAEACSDQQAADDAASGSPNSTFGACGEADSTGCPGWSGPAGSMLPNCLQMMWDEGPGGGSYDMLASDTYTQVACGFHTEQDGDVWVMLNFL